MLFACEPYTPNHKWINKYLYTCISDSRLRKVFTKVAQSPGVLENKRNFGAALGLSASEMDGIERQSNGQRDSTYRMLMAWKDHGGENADLKTLAKKLKRHKFHQAAGNVDYPISSPKRHT